MLFLDYNYNYDNNNFLIKIFFIKLNILYIIYELMIISYLNIFLFFSGSPKDDPPVLDTPNELTEFLFFKFDFSGV